MDEHELQRLQDEYRQVQTRARAAEAEFRAACQNYLVRVAESKIQRPEESKIMQRGRPISPKKLDHDSAEGNTATAQGNVQPARIVMLEAERKRTVLRAEEDAARIRTEEAETTHARQLRKTTLPRQFGHDNLQKLRLEQEKLHQRMEAQRMAEDAQAEIFRMDRFTEAEQRAEEERERIIRLDRERREKLREEAAERAQARQKEKEERRIRDKLREEAAERARARAARQKEAEEQRARDNKRRYEDWARREGHKFKNVGLANEIRPPSALASAATKLWNENVERAFTDYASMDKFPDPPSSLVLCNKAGCIASKDYRALAACSCQIEHAITSLQLPLKKLRWAWHPDRFSSCKEEHRESFKRKATEVFQVVDGMFAKERK